MAIKLYTGIQGSGKSYEVVTVVILGALRERRRVVSNIAGLNFEAMREILIAEGIEPELIGSILQVDHDDVLKPDFWRTDDDTKQGRVTTIQPGDVLILDEIWRFEEIFKASVRPSSVSFRVLNYFRMHRHMVHPELGFTCEVVLITQDVQDVPRAVRSVVEKTFVMTKHTELGTDKFYRVDVYSRARFNSRTEPLNSFQRKYNPELFKLYKSHSNNDGEIQAKEVSIDKRGNIWQRPVIKYGVPISLLVLVFAISKLWAFFHPVDVVVADAVKAPAVGVSTPARVVPVVDDSWRVMGSFYSGSSFVVALKNPSGGSRYIFNPPNYKIEGSYLTVELPEGGFATPYSGNFSVKNGPLL